MTDGQVHGTDCFEVDSFLQRNGTSKLYKVRQKETGELFTMEVAPRDVSSKAPVRPYIQQTKSSFSQFWVSLQFTFQTRSKFYYILEFPGKQTLSERIKSSGGLFPELIARFYAAEILIALGELHNSCLAYKDLTLDTVYLDSEGHVVIWRSFCGKFYWSKQECVCSLDGFCHGDPCDNNHNLKSDFDYQEDWRSFGSVICAMLTGEIYPRPAIDRSLSAAASDLISRLLRGEVCRGDQIQSHPFFKGVNWHEIRARRSPPPMSSSNEPTSFPSKTSSSVSYLPMGPITGNGPSLQRPHTTPHQSDPSMGPLTGNGPSLHGLHSITSDPSLWPKTENGPSLQRPRRISRHSDPSMGVNLDYGPSSPNRPHSQSHHSDPGDQRYFKSVPGHMVPGSSLHHADSTPDLRASGLESSFSPHYQQRLMNDVNHLYKNPEYQYASARDFPSRLNSGLEARGRLVSRSLSDLSNLGNDPGFLSHSPTALQRTFAYPNYESSPRHTQTLYFQSNEATEIYNGEYGLRSSGSVPDLSASYPPFNPPYYTSLSGRASPTPSQYSDISSSSSYTTEPSPRIAFLHSRSRLSDSNLSLNDRGYVARENGNTTGLQRYDRESEYLRSKSETPSSFGRGQSPLTSSLQSSFDYSSRSNIPIFKSSTQPSSLQGSGSTTKDEANRTTNGGSRERSSTLSRTLSLSNLGEEKKQSIPREVSDKRRDSLPLSVGNAREKYPLAKVPIPSFREFKQKNLERSSKLSNTLVGKKVAKEDEDSKSPKTSTKHDSKPKADMRSTLKERLSSLYERSKDISAQNATKRLTESYKWNSSGNVKIEEPIYIAKSSTDLTEAKQYDSDAVKETKTSRKVSKGRQESPFSKNEVIHQLMLKYGLYEKGDQKKSKSPKNERKEGLTGHTNSDVKEESCENESKRKTSSRGKENLTVEGEKNWRNSTDHSNRSTGKSSLVSPRENNQSSVNESKKSAAERFRELRRKNGIRNDIARNVREDASKGNLTEDSSSEKSSKEKDVAAKSSGQNLDTSVADISKGRTLAVKSKISAHETCSSPADDLNADSDSPRKTKNAISLRGTSRAVLCATKFKRNKDSKSSGGSPLPSKKQIADIIGKSDVTSKVKESGKMEANDSLDTNDVKRNDSMEKPSPNTRRRRFRGERGLRRGGIHTSMLSVASSAPSDTEMDDTVSIYGDMDSLDDERGIRGRRWESFHSNISADSGSAHLFEFETDSNATEFDEVFDDQDSEDDHPKGEVDVERTDSGVGGDMGQSPLRRSWEEIVMKSSEHWSVVAASARHWQELARRRKANESENTAPRKKSSTHSITENMVECPDCLKHYVPPKEKSNSSEPEICSKCKDRKVERKEAIIELVQTEINYGNDLQILKEEFYVPMQSGGIFSPENLAAIFLNLQELLEVNSKFCAKLQKSLEESVAKGDEEFSEVNVGAIFLESVDFFQAYEIYCSKQTSASALLESLQKKTELLRIFLNVTCRENPKCRKMDLNSFILAPVQRIMKYPLLLSRICKATPRRNTDREKLKMAQRKIEEQLNKINALNTTVESRQKRYRASQPLGRSDSLDKLQMKKMASDILNWTMGEMQLLMHGVFQITIHEFSTAWNRRNSKRALSVCALFCVRGHAEFLRIDSDDEGECEEPLFPGEGEVTDAAIVLLRKKMSGKYTLFKDPLYLDMCVIYRDSELKDAFEVVSVGKESYVFRASTSREYRRWLKYLRLESKELGAWKRRRNGLPNIMIKNL